MTQSRFDSEQEANDYKRQHQLISRVAEPVGGGKWGLVHPIQSHIQVFDGAAPGMRLEGVSGRSDPFKVYETGSDNTCWNSQVIRVGDRCIVRVFDADGDRRPDREVAVADQALAIALADLAVLRFSGRVVLAVSAIEAAAFRCLNDKAPQSAARFTELVGMSPERFTAEVEGGHSRNLVDRLTARFSGPGGVSMLDDLAAWADGFIGTANAEYGSRFARHDEQLEVEMSGEYIELEVTLRSKTTFGTDKETIRVWDGQSAKDVAALTAFSYGAEVVEIRNPDGSLYVESEGVDVSPSDVPSTELASRIHHAATAAQSSFWAALAESFPEIKTGDFPPGATEVFDSACVSAATTWVNSNMPRRVARTSDGYAFTEGLDGSWSDGDMTFDNLSQLLEQDPDLLIDGVPDSESANSVDRQRG